MTNQVIPNEAVKAAERKAGELFHNPLSSHEMENIIRILEAAAPHMLAAEYRRGYRDGLTDRKQVTAEPRAWEPGDPIE